MSLNQSKEKSIATRLYLLIAAMFSKFTKPAVATPFRVSKYKTVGPKRPAGNKIKRAIRRGNHGVVHKSGTYAKVIAENEREKWFIERGQIAPHLSTY